MGLLFNEKSTLMAEIILNNTTNVSDGMKYNMEIVDHVCQMSVYYWRLFYLETFNKEHPVVTH